MSHLKGCEPTCDEPSQRSPAISLRTTFWDASGGRSSLESAFSTLLSRLDTYKPQTHTKTSLCLPGNISLSQFLFYMHTLVCVCPTLLISLFLRSERSLVLSAGTSDTSSMTVTGSVLCSTSTSTAKTGQFLGTPLFTSLVGG